MAREASRPQVSWRETPVTCAILLATVLVHVAGVLSADLQAMLFEHGAQRPALVDAGQWYRLLTSAFLHAHDGADVVTHVGLNMFWLWLVGSQLEPRMGGGSFAALYVASAVGGGALAHAAGVGGVGASGAIFGLLGFWLPGVVRGRGTPQGRDNLRAWLFLSLYMLVAPFLPGGQRDEVGWHAHIGGWSTGFAIGVAWLAMADRRPRIGRAVVTAGLGAIPLVLLLISLAPVAGVAADDSVAWTGEEAYYSKTIRAESLRTALGDKAAVTQAQPPASEPVGITVDPRAFGVMADGDITSSAYVDGIVVLTPRTGRASVALRRAADRWMLIDQTGREWALADIEAAELEPDFSAWTVPLVGYPEAFAEGVRTYVDFEGSPPMIPMQVRFIEVLVDELARAGVPAAHIAPDIPVEGAAPI